MFSNKDLILISGITSRTYYRRMHEIKESKEFEKKIKGSLLSVDEAKTIAEKLGFTYRLEKHLLKK